MDTRSPGPSLERTRSHRLSNILATLVLVLGAIVAGTSLISTSAMIPGHRAEDIGTAIVLAITATSAFYGSWGLAVLAAAGTIVARGKQAPSRRWVLGLIVALIPTAFLFIVDFF